MRDFPHTFRHTTERRDTGRGRSFETPLWVVGSSPFDAVKAEGEGHVVHLGEPRFVARWFAGDRPLNPTDNVSGIVYHDEELDITVCEVVVFDEQRSAFDEWLVEATAAIARWRGDRDSAEPETR